ncbi:hypothetical protein [Nesterenkonia natronophila]|uniref:Uncharacterized protein n=1 Tax=Nesterenkonia natronophila TaxID=2174932 RepID=A0A3A4EYV6_9MICC|nr:hypothetical protein [Nesterenkonia natronophila]RJN31033.1 hypothetical protein D3250_09150 [Nesterenkonia natronophila]
MVIRTERNPREEQLVAALRAVFDASVMNYGSYNLIYAENIFGREEHPELLVAKSGGPSAELSAQEAVESARHLLVGYRREPAELVLCPIDPAALLPLADADGAISPRVPVLVNLTNLAGMASEDTTVEIALSTGRRVKLDIQVFVTFSQIPGVPLHQDLDVEDFYTFLDHFMDVVERKSA